MPQGIFFIILGAGLYMVTFREHFRLRSYRYDCPYEPSYNSTGMTEVINQYSPALLKHIQFDNYNKTGTNVRIVIQCLYTYKYHCLRYIHGQQN